MYTSVQSPRRWNTVAPVVCILLLGLILFAIAATIVISLIILYLPTRNVAVASLNNDIRSSLRTEKQNIVSSNTEAKIHANIKVANVVGRNSEKRHRRDASERATSVTIIFELLFTRLCVSKRCHARVLELARKLFAKLKPKLHGSESESSAMPTPNAPTLPFGDEVTGNIELISQYWANLRPYEDNPDNLFGVTDTGLPAGCQVEQAFVLHRHAARYPGAGDLVEINHVTGKLHRTTGIYTGPMTFFNTWKNQLGHDLLLAEGTYMEYQSGVDFWVRYGRILYNAKPGQTYYNAAGQTKPQLRCNTIPRITDSARAWADGFFTLYNRTDKYTLLRMPVGVGINNTLASYASCRNFANSSYGLFNFGEALYYPIHNYLKDTVARLKQYMPADVNLTVLDVFMLQSLCPFEYTALGSSDFCSLFTLNEWRGFRYTYDIYLYNGFSFGSPVGRALGLGVLQELIARLQRQTIPISSSSVNITYDGNINTFPLGQKFYLDMTHDFMVIGLLTAMSLDYFRQDLPLDSYPPPEDRHFKTTNVVPYAARIITENIGCISSNPTAIHSPRAQYTPTQYGYSVQNATHKFIRMRLNNGILPLSSIRGGYCSGRTDGLCSLQNFLASQTHATAEANYDQVCFGNYVYNASRFTGDGNYFP